MGYKIELVRNAMLAVQRYPWEQGVCAQALYEIGDETTAMAMAHDAILRQQPDGRLAVTGANTAVTDPAANGEVVWRAYEMTGETFYKEGAERMLRYLMHDAPRTADGIICHVDVEIKDGIPSRQLWVDSCYMAPPFLAVMGELDEAYRQLKGYVKYLKDKKTGLLYHIYDEGTGEFIRKKLWATGNGWALLGIARVIECAAKAGRRDLVSELSGMGREIMEAMLKYRLEDGRFHDILVEEDSFVEGAAAMMLACYIYRGIYGGWLVEPLQEDREKPEMSFTGYAEKVQEAESLENEYFFCAENIVDTMEKYVDNLGIIREVCGCPHFVSPGTSAESMAAYLMMHAWKKKLENTQN